LEKVKNKNMVESDTGILYIFTGKLLHLAPNEEGKGTFNYTVISSLTPVL
jgi:hypothetical protein